MIFYDLFSYFVLCFLVCPFFTTPFSAAQKVGMITTPRSHVVTTKRPMIDPNERFIWGDFVYFPPILIMNKPSLGMIVYFCWWLKQIQDEGWRKPGWFDDSSRFLGHLVGWWMNRECCLAKRNFEGNMRSELIFVGIYIYIYYIHIYILIWLNF